MVDKQNTTKQALVPVYLYIYEENNEKCKLYDENSKKGGKIAAYMWVRVCVCEEIAMWGKNRKNCGTLKNLFTISP